MNYLDKTPRILIIDDEEVVLDSCKQILRKENYVISTVSNGDLGLEVLPEFEPDLVFVDLKMPGLSGLEVLNKIKGIDPNIVTIVITGYSTVASAIDSMKNGAYDFLPKPFTPEEFRMITHRGIERRKLVLETIALKHEKEMLREHFAAVVSHELKSPLSAVQQNLYLLEIELSEILNEDQKNRIERMKSKVNDLIDLIHSWLRVISVDVNRLKENFNNISIETIIIKAIENVEPLATRKQINIISPKSNLKLNIYGDEGTLVEALGNVLGNAIKYSQVGGQIEINLDLIETYLQISISDKGIGISKEDIPFIFEDFFTGETGQKIEKGSGLGLAITRRIIEAHDGSITVSSVLGEGTTVMIKLPYSST
jgi:two-component system sensor histidine kinase/response regulator